MPLPVKVSNELLAAARATAARANRSVTKQIQHWAELGRVIEALVTLPNQCSRSTVQRPEAPAGWCRSGRMAEK